MERIKIGDNTALRCEHGHLAAVITPKGIEIKMRDGCVFEVPWPKIEVRIVKDLTYTR